jgi:hypothetical protein
MGADDVEFKYTPTKQLRIQPYMSFVSEQAQLDSLYYDDVQYVESPMVPLVGNIINGISNALPFKMSDLIPGFEESPDFSDVFYDNNTASSTYHPHNSTNNPNRSKHRSNYGPNKIKSSHSKSLNRFEQNKESIQGGNRVYRDRKTPGITLTYTSPTSSITTNVTSNRGHFGVKHRVGRTTYESNISINFDQIGQNLTNLNNLVQENDNFEENIKNLTQILPISAGRTEMTIQTTPTTAMGIGVSMVNTNPLILSQEFNNNDHKTYNKNVSQKNGKKKVKKLLTPGGERLNVFANFIWQVPDVILHEFFGLPINTPDHDIWFQPDLPERVLYGGFEIKATNYWKPTISTKIMYNSRTKIQFEFNKNLGQFDLIKPKTLVSWIFRFSSDLIMQFKGLYRIGQASDQFETFLTTEGLVNPLGFVQGVNTVLESNGRTNFDEFLEEPQKNSKHIQNSQKNLLQTTTGMNISDIGFILSQTLPQFRIAFQTKIPLYYDYNNYYSDTTSQSSKYVKSNSNTSSNSFIDISRKIQGENYYGGKRYQNNDYENNKNSSESNFAQNLKNNSKNNLFSNPTRNMNPINNTNDYHNNNHNDVNNNLTIITGLDTQRGFFTTLALPILTIFNVPFLFNFNFSFFNGKMNFGTNFNILGKDDLVMSSQVDPNEYNNTHINSPKMMKQRQEIGQNFAKIGVFGQENGQTGQTGQTGQILTKNSNGNDYFIDEKYLDPVAFAQGKLPMALLKGLDQDQLELLQQNAQNDGFGQNGDKSNKNYQNYDNYQNENSLNFKNYKLDVNSLPLPRLPPVTDDLQTGVYTTVTKSTPEDMLVNNYKKLKMEKNIGYFKNYFSQTQIGKNKNNNYPTTITTTREYPRRFIDRIVERKVPHLYHPTEDNGSDEILQRGEHDPNRYLISTDIKTSVGLAQMGQRKEGSNKPNKQ